MNAEEIRNYVLKKNDVTESFPFGEGVLVFKVNNKMFLLLALNEEKVSINVKCDPDKAVELREDYPELILPGYHMNKTHWNTLLPEALKKVLVFEMIDDSYDLVLKINGKKK
jgi:predicted DNA-binding protein (MmcQ/YjbR family)